MNADALVERFSDYADRDAIVWKDKTYAFDWLQAAAQSWQAKLNDSGIDKGSVVVLKADFSPNAVALFLALSRLDCIIVPLTTALTQNEDDLLKIAQAQYVITIDADDDAHVARLPYRPTHERYRRLTEIDHPGLVLFSSGSTGPSKAALHDLQLLMEKFEQPRRAFRSIAFLLYDHIGGINTMLYALANGGCLVAVADRSPDAVLASIARHRVDLLPTSPTFINLILLSEAYRRYDLSTLRIVTYGTEPMPQATLDRFHRVLPDIELRQTYGLSEIGIMRSKSKGSESLWVKIGGEGYATRVVDGILHVKANSAMLGYLNHPDPFTDDGWLVTGDRVEQDGDYFRFLGRDSELINVGGEKVFPAAVENVIQSMDNVAEVAVYGLPNSIVGEIVCADVRLQLSEDKKMFVRRLKKNCQAELMPYMVPVKVNLVSKPIHSARYKKIRENYA